MEHFSEREFSCKCGNGCGKGLADMQASTIGKLIKARVIAGVPFVLTSAVRCDEHNASPDVGGSVVSSHLDGWAVDILAEDSLTRFKILGAIVKAGFTRIGIGSNYVHVDNDPDKPECLIWLYERKLKMRGKNARLSN